MSILYWAFVGILMEYNFGGWGIFFTVMLILAADFIPLFIAVKEELLLKEIKNENVFVTIEIVEHKGQNMFLVFDALNKKFVLQGMSFDEIKDALKTKYEGKSIFVKDNERSFEPIYIAPTSGLLPK